MYIDSIPIRILNVFLLFLASSFRLTYSGQVVLWFGGCGGIVMVSCSCSSFGLLIVSRYDGALLHTNKDHKVCVVT